MSSAAVYSNHAGTMSESFVIGKRGVKLLQGVGDPTGISAPVGSLYLRRDGARCVYQKNADNWVALLYAEAVTKFATFTNSDLVSGVLTIVHTLGVEFPIVQVWNDSRELVFPDKITCVDDSTVTIDLNSSGAISSTWRVRVSL
jgi:hypothetical protein